MTYAVVDLRARDDDLRARRPHPLIYVPGPSAPAAAQAQILAPDGLVLGLKIDDGEMFERLLEEETIPLDAGDLYRVLHRRHHRGDERGATTASARSGWAQLVEEHAHLPSEELRERILREIAGVCRRRAAARRHDDDPAEGRQDVATVAAASSSASLGVADVRPGRHLPHPVRHRGQHRRGAARSHGVDALPHRRATRRRIFPLTVNALGEIRISVRRRRRRRGARASSTATATERRRRQRRAAARRVRRRCSARIGYRFRDRGLLEHAMTHTSRANEDVERRRGRQRVARVPRRRRARLRRRRRAVPRVSRLTTKGRSRRSRRRWSRRRRWRGRPSGCGSATTCCSAAARRRPAAAASRRCWPTATRR